MTSCPFASVTRAAVPQLQAELLTCIHLKSMQPNKLIVRIQRDYSADRTHLLVDNLAKKKTLALHDFPPGSTSTMTRREHPFILGRTDNKMTVREKVGFRTHKVGLMHIPQMSHD
jgi:hypothetical protein